MSFFDEFKDFISKGNILDMAVGVVIGGAFGKIITSLVDDIIMPTFGSLVNVDFTGLFLGKIAIGNFIQQVVNFLIISFAIFSFLRSMDRIVPKKEKQKEDPEPSKEEKLLTEIRDLLKEK